MLSQSHYLTLAATTFATIFTGFGINAILRPSNALTFFELSPPSSTADQNFVEALMIVYGARDIFMGLAIYAASYFGNRKTLGRILVAGSAVAFVDGAVCRVYAGKGEMNHWGYAPALTVVGGGCCLGFWIGLERRSDRGVLTIFGSRSVQGPQEKLKLSLGEKNPSIGLGIFSNLTF